MSANSKIQWTDHTFNPWIGCTKVSPGCANCYAETEDKRRGWTPQGWGKGKERKPTSRAYWKQPYKWNAEAKKSGTPAKVFCASLADVFDPEVPGEWRKALFDTITDTPHLIWQLLTKRPEVALDFYHNEIGLRDETIIGKFLPNVWLGVSVEDQKRADERIPLLLQIPAKIRFLSCEPLLGPVDLGRFCFSRLSLHHDELVKFLHWVIIGGESGPKARPCSIDWIREIALQCKSAGVPVFVKQLGAYVVFDNPSEPAGASYVGKLKDRKGGDPFEWPTDLRVREFPVSVSSAKSVVASS
jgi:protein gp37